MQKSIWLVKVFEKSGKTNKTNFLKAESIGWFNSEADAAEAVKNNRGDMWETCFDYAVIEEIPSGLYPISKNRTFWKYKGAKENVYEQITEPKFLKDYTNWF